MIWPMAKRRALVARCGRRCAVGTSYNMCGRFALSILPDQFQQAFGCDRARGPDRRAGTSRPTARSPLVRAREAGRPRGRLRPLGPARPVDEGGERPRPPDQRPRRDRGREADVPRQLQEGPLPDPGDRLLRVAEGRLRPVAARSSSPSPRARPSPSPACGAATAWPTAALLDSCAILTTDASPLLRPIHHRMPVILPAASQPLVARPGHQGPGAPPGTAHARPRCRARRLGSRPRRQQSQERRAAAGRAGGAARQRRSSRA